MKQEVYKNGQVANELTGETLTYYYENGTVRAVGPYIKDMMEGEWIFYRKTGQLWAVSNFKNNKKHGRWIRYDRNDKLEFDEIFDEGKKVKKK